MMNKEYPLLLDKYLPEYDFTEVHTIKIRATPEVAYRAMQDTTLGEIHGFVRFLKIEQVAQLVKTGGEVRREIAQQSDQRPAGDGIVQNCETDEIG